MSAGKELKCPIDRVFTDDEVNALVLHPFDNLLTCVVRFRRAGDPKARGPGRAAAGLIYLSANRKLARFPAGR